jgi:peptidoglycan/LPS O-acetylase OafA/YrhL
MNTTPGNDNGQLESKSWREERRGRREARRAALGSPSKGGVLIAGLILVILGAVVLLQNSGNFILSWRNWGALFILLPAIAAFDRGARYYRNAGNQLNTQARSAILIGIFLLVVMFVILLNMNWTIWGPVLIILAGVLLLFNSQLKG